MKAAIMQPYLLPYIGYFQLIGAADVFIVYDNIKYTKKGWINRNRFLRNGADVLFSVPLRKDSDFLDVREREIAPDFDPAKVLNPLREAYRRAPFFEPAYEVAERVFTNPERNLFAFLLASLEEACAYLGLHTRIVVSSTLDCDHALQGEERVLAICRAVGAGTYINPPGGMDLYSKASFDARGIALRFLRPRPFEYAQLGAPFVPWLSILDVMMFNSRERIGEVLATNYDLVEGTRP